MTMVFSALAGSTLRDAPQLKQLNGFLTAAVAPSFFPERWELNGSIEESESCELAVAKVLPPDCTTAFAYDMATGVFSNAGDLPLELFKPFGIIYNRIASTLCLAARGADTAEAPSVTLETLLESRWRASYSHLIAFELYKGTTNPSLTSEDTPLAGTATSVRLGVAELELEAGLVFGNQEVTFHVPLSTLAVGVSDLVFMLDGTNRYRTASGNLVIGDAGYVPDTGDRAAPFIFVSGPVNWAVSTPQYYTVFSPDAASMRVNKVFGSLLGQAIVTFPADCPVISKKATLT